MERIEFKTFTKMSENSMVDYKDLIDYARELGQKALAITDHNSVEVFPKVDKYIKEIDSGDFKIIYGTTVDMLENDFLIPVTIIVREPKGLKNLYKIISRLKTDNLEKFGKQVIRRDDLVELSDGLLYGLDALAMNCIYDEQTDEQVSDDMMWYDFIEVQALTGYEEYIKRIVKIASDSRKIVIATGDVCYVKASEKEDYEILFPKCAKKRDGYLKSTSEMLDVFRFINDDELLLDIVVNNPNKLTSLVDDIKINSNKKYLPTIDNSKSILLDMVYSKAHEMYGNPLPELIEKRLGEELYGLNSNDQKGIINLQYETIFLINQRLVQYSHHLGYPVCARGNVASSLVAYFMGLTDINPLPPHYHCPNCNEIIFSGDDICGLDLPNKKCPICHQNMTKDGFNLAYSDLLGEDVSKFPHININYCLDIEKELDKYLIDMFGKDKVYKAGVVSVRQKKEVQKELDALDKNNHLKITEEKKKSLATKLDGTIKVIGKHPSANFIVPKEKSIYDFTPITYACDNPNYNKVTYFDYYDLNKVLLPVNILFHNSVSILKELEDITGISSDKVNFDDAKTMELINNGHTDNILEIGMNIEKAMIEKDRPISFTKLIEIVIKAHRFENFTLPKAHAASYAVLAYKLAWYKANYPQEFKKISAKY